MERDVFALVAHANCKTNHHLSYIQTEHNSTVYRILNFELIIKLNILHPSSSVVREKYSLHWVNYWLEWRENSIWRPTISLPDNFPDMLYPQPSILGLAFSQDHPGSIAYLWNIPKTHSATVEFSTGEYSMVCKNVDFIYFNILNPHFLQKFLACKSMVNPEHGIPTWLIENVFKFKHVVLFQKLIKS